MKSSHYRTSTHPTLRQYQAAVRFATHLGFEGYDVQLDQLCNLVFLQDQLPAMVDFSSNRRIFIDAIDGWSFGKLPDDDSLHSFFASQLAFSFRPRAISILGSVLRSGLFAPSVEAAEHLGDLAILLPPSPLRSHVQRQLVACHSPLSQKEFNLSNNHAIFPNSEDWPQNACAAILSEPLLPDPVLLANALASSWA